MFIIPVKSKAVPKDKAEETKYTCMICMKDKKEDDFFKSQWTKLWNYSNKRVLFCKDCVDNLMKEYTDRYGEKTALMICCAILDIPFFNITYHSIIEKNSFFNIGLYIRMLNGRQFQYKTFLNSITEEQIYKPENEIKEELKTKWSVSDKRNMNFAISVIGYDPFDGFNLMQEDLKFCYNNLAGYCNDDSVRSDNHKLQSIIQITQSQLQCRKVDQFINIELLSLRPDEEKIKQLTTTKKQLLDSIAKIAQDNNLSSNYNQNSKKGANTLSDKMNKMAADDYEEIQVNLFDIKTSEAMKQIADLSNSSILEQLSFDSNDYTEMINEQRDMILKFEENENKIKEENRILKNKIEELKNQINSKKGR